MSKNSLVQGRQKNLRKAIPGHELCDIDTQSQVKENRSKESPWKQCKRLILVMFTRARVTCSAYLLSYRLRIHNHEDVEEGKAILRGIGCEVKLAMQQEGIGHEWR
jgi:hypothetical protein